MVDWWGTAPSGGLPKENTLHTLTQSRSNRLWLLVVAVLLTIGVAVVASTADNPVTGSASPAAAYQPNSYSYCNQSVAWGTRVCYDRGDRYVYIYHTAPYTSPNISFPTNGYYGGSGYNQWGGTWANQAGYDEVTVQSPNLYVMGNVQPLGRIFFYENSGCYDYGNVICVYGGNFNYLQWYATGTPGYEFIVTDS